MENVETVATADSTFRISGENGTRRDALYQAVMALSRSIAGRTDLRSLLSGVAESLRQIVSFDHVALILHDPNGNAMQGHILNEPGNPVITSLRLPVDEDPAGWVWLNQRPLVISSLQSETRWPEFVRRSRDFGITTLVLVPLTTGDNRLGAFGFSSVAPLEPKPGRDGIPGACCQRVRRCGRVLSGKAGGSPGAGPAANAVRHHQCAGVEAGSRRVVFRDIRPALEGHPARLRAADAVQSRPAPWTYTLCIPRFRSLWRHSRDHSTRWACLRNRCSPPASQWWPAKPISTAIRIRIFDGLWRSDSNPFARFH